MKLAPFGGKLVTPEGLGRFSGQRLGIDTDKLAYYAVSLVWRAAVYKWRTLEGQTTTVELDDKRQEELRHYLLGHTGLPSDVGVVVTVCTDRESQGWIFLPTKAVGRDYSTSGVTMYGVLVRGILFHVIVNAPGRFPLRDICCVRSEDKVLWVRDCAEETKHSFMSLKAKARVAENLKRRV
ncbi:MAG TPA: hypothetical protein VKZ53_23790 [Candidatus Angelobacter sp.]|nr:hypothetical protein [Candidatus Angelobacter sp.]